LVPAPWQNLCVKWANSPGQREQIWASMDDAQRTTLLRVWAPLKQGPFPWAPQRALTAEDYERLHPEEKGGFGKVMLTMVIAGAVIVLLFVALALASK